jgi:hypothetical protein
MLSSCAGVSTALENTGGMAGVGAAVGAVIGANTGHGNRQQRAVIGGLIGAGAGAAISLGYKASLKQRSEAQANANYALTRNSSVMKSVKASGAKYVAVPVKSDPNEPKSQPALLRVKVERSDDGTMKAGEVDPNAYPVETAKSGSEINVGGSPAVFYDI